MKKARVSVISNPKSYSKTASKINLRNSKLDDASSLQTTPSNIRISNTILDDLQLRTLFKVVDNGEDVTPKQIGITFEGEDFTKLQKNVDEFLSCPPEKLITEEVTIRRNSLGAALRVSMDDVVQGISNGLLILYEHSTKSTKKSVESGCLQDTGKKVTPFIKILLRQTDDIVLYEQRSTTVPFGTEDADRVERENKAYEYVTKGKGRLRRKADSEAQTTSVLYKSRDANTDIIKKFNVGSYVSNFEMFDTYRQLEQIKSNLTMGDKTLQITTLKMGGVDSCEKIGLLQEFEFAQMVMQRCLAGNVFKEQQRRFRNMYMPDPLAMQLEYVYRVEVLWDLLPRSEAKERYAVSSMSWCPSNGDILAVGYGLFTCAPNFSLKRGYVCIWSIKNPVSPESIFDYGSAVLAVEFSPFRPQLLAIGLYDGSVEVRDITTEGDCTVAISQRETSPGYEPITDIKWIGLDPGETADIEPFLTVSQDGSIMRYRVINSPYLLGYVHAVLDRVEGSPEGLLVQRPWNKLEAVRHPQCLGITLDPTRPDIFYVISNEGVLYKCSTNYPQQHLDLWQAHEGAVYSMEFSPWSPKLFLTCGDDWCIRIWIEGIFKPLITLTSKLCPVNCALWSKTHSTIIVSISRRTVDVWDIRRSTLKPMSSTKIKKSYFTLTKFSNCGRSLAVGNERGKVFMCALEDMPFSPHFQYEELEAAIFKALMPFPELVTELKGVGYFGYRKTK